MHPAAQPLLGIRMTHILPPSQTDGLEQEDILDCLDVLVSQDASYSCEDYLKRSAYIPADCEESKRDEVVDLNSVDASCREKMAEWGYRVCDHFHVPRTIVAIAFSYLDRFVNKCSCDRTAFKLASMTTLYMATKVFNNKQLSIATLAELSRGEFDVSHIAEMEGIILKTLNWKLNPPIVQDFIQYFLAFIPARCPQRTAITQRAMFFAALCIYDYDLVCHARGVIALASLFNAIDDVVGMDDAVLAGEMEMDLLQAVRSLYPSCVCGAGDFHILPSTLLHNTQRRLWYLYSCSAQAVQDKTPASPCRNKGKQRKVLSALKQAEPQSPTSVHQIAAVSTTAFANKDRYGTPLS